MCLEIIQEVPNTQRTFPLAQTAPITQVVRDAEIRARQIATASIGDTIAWKPDVVSAEIELTTAQSKLISKCFDLRLQQREDLIEECVHGIEASDPSDRKTIDDCLAALSRHEAKQEKLMMEKLEEILLPQQYEGLVQSIIRRDNLGFAEVIACAEYLNLTSVQRTAFIKAKEKMIKILIDRAERGESNVGVISENEKLGEVIMSPVHLLDKSQLENYLHARKMVENGVSLHDHFKKTGEKGRSKLKKMFPIFKIIEAEIEKDVSNLK